MFFYFLNILTVRNFLRDIKSYMTEVVEEYGRKEIFWRTLTSTETAGDQPLKLIKHGDIFLLLLVKNYNTIVDIEQIVKWVTYIHS